MSSAAGSDRRSEDDDIGVQNRLDQLAERFNPSDKEDCVVGKRSLAAVRLLAATHEPLRIGAHSVAEGSLASA
jgi:hypothetical protein